jgi:hypothetical protein
MSIPLISVIVLVIVSFAFFFFRTSIFSNENTDCVPEGGKSYGESPDPKNCCAGLSSIAVMDTNGVMTYDIAYCTKCGDGKCKKPENRYNCQADCR